MLTRTELDAIRERARRYEEGYTASSSFAISSRTDIPALLAHIAELEAKLAAWFTEEDAREACYIAAVGGVAYASTGDAPTIDDAIMCIAMAREKNPARDDMDVFVDQTIARIRAERKQ